MNINNLKELVKDCVYEEDGIVCMNNDYYCNILKEIERLNNIIKEAREYIDRRDIDWGSDEHNHVLQILDKVNK